MYISTGAYDFVHHKHNRKGWDKFSHQMLLWISPITSMKLHLLVSQVSRRNQGKDWANSVAVRHYQLLYAQISTGIRMQQENNTELVQMFNFDKNLINKLENNTYY